MNGREAEMRMYYVYKKYAVTMLFYVSVIDYTYTLYITHHMNTDTQVKLIGLALEINLGHGQIRQIYRCGCAQYLT